MGTLLLTLWKVALQLRVVLHAIASFFKTDNHLHRARFAGISEVAGKLSPRPFGTSLLLGARGNDFVSVTPTKTRAELGNLLVVAPTRGGKGLLAVSQLLTWPHSVVINDIKGELFTQTAGYRQTLGPVFVIDPKGIGHRFDPLSGKQTEDEFFSAASHLLMNTNEGEGRIFTERAIVMLAQMLLASRIEAIAPLPYVRFLIRLGLADTAAHLNTIEPQLATQFLDVRFSEANFSDRFLLSSWGTLTARMRPLLTETVVRSLTHSDFTPGELMTAPKPVTVYLRWPEQDLLSLAPLVRLLWGSMIDQLITTYDRQQGRGCREVLLLIDEAGRTAIPSLADQATTVVGRAISLWIAIQSLSQLETVYGRARAQTLRDNMESQLYYRPSDQATADYLEHRLGRRSGLARSQTLRDGAPSAEGLTEQGIPLKTAQEIQQMSDGEIIGFHRNLPPLELSRIDWRNDQQLCQRRAIVPPPLVKLPPLTKLELRNEAPLTPLLLDPDYLQDEPQDAA